jgi:beta-glucanase (GH16 family)
MSGPKLSDAFHVYAIEWTPDSLRWLIDDVAYQTFTKDQATAMGMSWGLDHPFYILLNLAVGGSFDGPPGRATTFPAQLFIDRVAVGAMPEGTDASVDAAAPDAPLAEAATTDAPGD